MLTDMINLFVEFGFQPLNMEALFDFELIETSSIINKFEARNITIIVTIFRKTKMLENMRIFIPEKVLIYTCVEMPVGFTNVASTTALACVAAGCVTKSRNIPAVLSVCDAGYTARTSKFVYNT